ncbi:MAG: mechanosensitive ion channel [Tenacibaculum sp.]|nr:mechanosensitive ion channel [Tenacibaculum sp.]
MKEFLIQFREQTVSILQETIHLPAFWAVVVQSIIVFILILLFAWVANRIATKLMRSLAPVIIGKTKIGWREALLENKVFSKISNFIPAIVVLNFYHFIASEDLRHIIELFIDSYFIIVFLILANSVINAISDISKNIEGEIDNPQLYLQLIKVILFSLGIIAIISIFANRNFIDILKGLGTMITILLIVYKDTIMGFVAGIQLSANKMVKVGDWVSLPKDNADGTVTEISLNTVKIQNFDQTITTIPTYKLMAESFTNWKGMEESGGRRIKRHIKIDMNSIHFLSTEEINRLRKFKLLEKYISNKLEELENSNKGEKEWVNQRKISNIGTFRRYIENYLLSTGYVNTDMTFMVRQLQSTEIGVPIEIYFFCKEKSFVNYEQVQSNIFEHIISIVPEFNLQIYQRLSDRLKNK